MEKMKPWNNVAIGHTDEQISNIANITKDQIGTIIQNIAAFALQMEVVKDYADFERIKKEINDFLMLIFKDSLEGKSADFILWFDQSNISKYQTEHELEKVELIRPGYAVEYDYVLPSQLKYTLETKKIRGILLLFQTEDTGRWARFRSIVFNHARAKELKPWR